MLEARDPATYAGHFGTKVVRKDGFSRWWESVAPMYRKLSYGDVARILADIELGVTATELAAKYKVMISCITPWRRYLGLNEDWIRYVKELETRCNLFERRCVRLDRQVDAGANVIRRLAAHARQRSKMVPLLRTSFKLDRIGANRVLGLSPSVGGKKNARLSDKELLINIREYMTTNPGHSFAWMAQTILHDSSYKRRDAVKAYVAMRDRQNSGRKNIGLPERVRKPMATQQQPNQVWSMDFLTDVLPGGRRFWVLCVLDDFNREAVLIEAVYRHTAIAVVESLTLMSDAGRVPRSIRTDNGPEFKSVMYKGWAAKHGVTLVYTGPWRANENAYVESFNRTLRREVLNRYQFKTLADVRKMLDDWRMRYNFGRPHSALEGLSPLQYAYVAARQRSARSPGL